MIWQLASVWSVLSNLQLEQRDALGSVRSIWKSSQAQENFWTEPLSEKFEELWTVMMRCETPWRMAVVVSSWNL